MRECSGHAMPYCQTHNRLFPHLCVGWLTPAGTQGLALIPAPCDACLKGLPNALLRRAFTVVSSRAAGVDHRVVYLVE